MRKFLLFIIPAIFSAHISLSQNIITGVIRDSLDKPVEGATVFIKNIHKASGSHSIADRKGQFSITTKQELPITLYISSVGFKTLEVPVFEWPASPLLITLTNNFDLTEVVITSRRRLESAQNVPIPITIVGGRYIADAGAFNVNRLKEAVPTVQLYSSNPRNTTLNVRGMGSTFGLTNDGVDPGVGFYVDGVYYARVAATTLDFINIDQVEVLRGPQGTLFGKNTTAGAFNITTKAPSFKPGAQFEVSYGNYGYIQAKSSITGPLSKKIAGRLSFSGTQRDGVLYNVATGKHLNDLNNIGFRTQLLYTPTDRVKITLAGDASR